MSNTGNTRTPNFSPAEDEILARCWIEISENVLMNNSQKKDEFWERITQSFEERTGTKIRKQKSLSNRWDLIRKATVKFSGYYNRIKNNPPSGTSEADYLKLAKENYYDDTRRMFTYDLAWAVLRNHEKWRDAGMNANRSKKHLPFTSSDHNATPTPSSLPETNPSSSQQPNPYDPPSSTDETNSRPMGIKKAKRQATNEYLSEKKLKIMEKNLAEGQKRGAHFNQANKLQEQMNAILKMEADLKSEHMELMIMEKDITTLTDEFSKEYFFKKKQAIILKMREKELESNAKSDASKSHFASGSQSQIPFNTQDVESEDGDNDDESDDGDDSCNNVIVDPLIMDF